MSTRDIKREMWSSLWDIRTKPDKALPFDSAQEGPPDRYSVALHSGRCPYRMLREAWSLATDIARSVQLTTDPNQRARDFLT